jgi:predicted acyl esterase
MATLCHVWPDGTATPIGEGAAVFNEVNGKAKVHVDLGNLGYRLPPGHLLRLALASSNYPRFALHPGTSDSAFEATTRVPMEVWVDITEQTFLNLLIVEDDDG